MRAIAFTGRATSTCKTLALIPLRGYAIEHSHGGDAKGDQLMTESLPHSQWKPYALDLGQRVRLLRMMRGLTQKRLAEISGISRTQISNLERNEYNGSKVADPQVSTVYRLAAALYVPPAALLPGAGVIYDGNYPEGESQVEIAMRWPRGPQDTARFAEAYLRLGARTNIARF